MFTRKLIDAVEANWQRIATFAIDEIGRDARLPHMRQLPQTELHEWARSILTSFPVWPVKLEEEELADRYEEVGQTRFRESVPLHECIRSLHHLKRKLIVFVRGECFPLNAVDLYAEMEFEQRTNMFFDQLLYHVAKGHDEARQGVHRAA